jgi:hypothetical protein
MPMVWSIGNEGFETIPAKEPKPATNLIAAKRKFTKVRGFARPLAELVAPPTMRDQAETSSTMIAYLLHDTLVDRNSTRQR